MLNRWVLEKGLQDLGLNYQLKFVEDDPGECPKCGMDLKEISFEKAKKNLLLRIQDKIIISYNSLKKWQLMNTIKSLSKSDLPHFDCRETGMRIENG